MTSEMRNKVIHIESARVDALAEHYMVDACGFDLEIPQLREMMNEALQTRDLAMDRPTPKAVVSCYDGSCFHHGELHIEGVTIGGGLLSRIPEEAVAGVYLYLLTAGNCAARSAECSSCRDASGDGEAGTAPGRNTFMDDFYANLWGVVYLDGGRQVLLEDHIRTDMARRFDGCKVSLSENMGPGYFGMPLWETEKFFQVLDGQAIGADLTETGTMRPKDTCAGMYLVWNGRHISEEPECASCAGNPVGCQLCGVRTRRKNNGKGRKTP